jgi:single-stranded DNA-binding protein
MVYIEGGLEVSDWTDKQGERHIDIAVSAQFLKILARSKNDGQGQSQGGYSAQPGNSAAADDSFADLPF